jgi:cytochrome oxidase Cu insertion factor (SCO1/SenC/PrrC family)
LPSAPLRGGRRVAHLGLAAAAIVLVACMSIVLAAPRLSRPIAVAEVGTVAPDFQLPDTEGRPVTLSSFRGRSVVLFFGNLHCPKTAVCNDRVGALAEQYARDGHAQFLAINVDRKSDRTDALQVRVDARVVGRTFPTLLDRKGTLADRYSARTTPSFILIDPTGVVRYRGPLDARDARDTRDANTGVPVATPTAGAPSLAAALAETVSNGALAVVAKSR